MWFPPVTPGTLSQPFGPATASNLHEPPMWHNLANTVANYVHDYALPLYSARYHCAFDIAAPAGTRIRAMQSGTVVFAGPDAQSDNSLKVQVQVNQHCWYSDNHCADIWVKVGQHVSQGQIIAHVGATGWASGPHDHAWAAYLVLVSGRWEWHFLNLKLLLPKGTYGIATGALGNDPRFAPA